MKPFMDDNFLLTSETARQLFHGYASKMPVIDYHCHINPREIFEDVAYGSLTEVWLGGDHYKWRAMRSNGVPEAYITGKETSPYEKFEKWAETVPKLIGNPLYHWTHLELQRYFGITEPLSPATCKSIWDRANQQLKTLSVRKIIEKSDVRLICTTDDPADDLVWHRKIREDKSFHVRVLPAFRPDKAINIDKPGFAEYLEKLGKVCGIAIKSADDVKRALKTRLAYFVELGCRAADHGLDYIVCSASHNSDAVLKKALAGQPVSQDEADAYKTDLLAFCAEQYRQNGVVMQLHYGAVRNNNPNMFAKLGPDTGYDAIYGRADSGIALGTLLGSLEAAGKLPKTVIYSLNPTDNALIDSIIGCFQSPEAAGKIQHGSAWWFNDTKTGIIEQMTSLANLSVLANFLGMLTDSRSFLSYTRHEYFRRILCEMLGNWVENGEYPADIATLGKMVEDISYNNTVRYFGFDKELKS